MTTTQTRLLKDLASMNAELQRLGAVRVEDDGFQWVDESVLAPEFARSYRSLVSAGYATGAL